MSTVDHIYEAEMKRLVRESDVIDKTDGSDLAKAFNYLWDRYIDNETRGSETNNIMLYELIAEQFEGLADLFHKLADKETQQKTTNE